MSPSVDKGLMDASILHAQKCQLSLLNFSLKPEAFMN